MFNSSTIHGTRRRITASWSARLLAAGWIAVCAAAASAEEPLLAPAVAPPNWTERLQQLEAADADLRRQIEQLQRANSELTQQLNGQADGAAARRSTAGTHPLGALSQPPDIRTDEPQSDSDDSVDDPFRYALIWSSEDDEWTLQFHNETQLDMRAFGHDHSNPVNQFGFYIPRMRMIFNGRLTKPIEYNVSINKGLGSLDLLDAYLNFNYDDRLQFRLGRYRVPFTYDWFALSNQFLSTMERSVFALNLGYNRNTAAMIHGELFDGEVDYAVAAANGPRNSYFDQNSAKDLLTYVNYRPFYHSEAWSALKHLNIGGSYSYGRQDQTPQPIAFHTSASASSSAGTPEGNPSFLELLPNVLERGIREQWEVHFAYYYKQLTLMGAFDRGVNTYGFRDAAGAVPVEAIGWHVQAAYFLTGEELTRRTFVEVLRPFDLRHGKFGLGAWEIQARFDHFELGDNVFTAGLSDPTEWTNSVNTIDCGFNWYLNRYLRIAFTWQHCMYDSPVVFRPGQSSDTNDLFWLRFQSNF